jgi:hypothetical protein
MRAGLREVRIVGKDTVVLVDEGRGVARGCVKGVEECVIAQREVKPGAILLRKDCNERKKT